MAAIDHPLRPMLGTYRSLTHRPLNCLALVAPLLVVFHMGSALGRMDLLASRDMERMLGVFGPTAWYAPPVLLVATLLMWHILKRYAWRIQAKVLVGMVAESIVWAAPLYAANYLYVYLPAAWAAPLVAAAGTSSGNATAQQILLGVGAGVYEEFIFRLLLIGLTGWLLCNILRLGRNPAILGTLVVSSLVFSLYHFSLFSGAAEPFDWSMCVFRTVAGLCLGIIFLARGFGIAVGAHAMWNIYCVLSNP